MPPITPGWPAADEAMASAIRLLSHRSRSEAEVRRRLSARFPPTVVDQVVLRLTERGLLNDLAFAQQWRQARERHRPRGSWAMRRELTRLGVASGVIDEALQGLDEEEACRRAAGLMAPRLAHLGQEAFHRKLSSYLRRRGFGYGAVRDTVQRAWEELSDPVNGGIDGDEGAQDQGEDAGA
jgi:regulatory protein